mmetsp:Transcript_43561/g.87830  ORF Transcript_43561/g.87830 Transcript_43561/m.87830 type:complete len:446 (-) Transcript_43561:73-1410(-)
MVEDEEQASSNAEPLLPKSPDVSKKSPKDSHQDLPDLTEHIAKAGLMKEYQRYRQGYLLWRQGHARGARGEVTEEGLVQERMRMEILEPTDEEWHWRKTISFWIVVMSLEGSFIFLFTSLSGCFPSIWGNLLDVLTVRMTFVGGSMFYVSLYLVCFEVINLKSKVTHWNPFNVPRSLRHCHEIGLHRWPYLAGLLYFIGANLFQVELTASLFPSVLADPFLNRWVVQVPTAVGGVFFFLASLCEVPEWLSESGRGRIAFFAVVNDVLGCALFAIAGFVYMVPPTPTFDSNSVGGGMYAVGSTNFVVSGVFTLMLWRDGNFGLAYSAQLGKLAHHESPGRFSALSILMVTGLCLFGTIAAAVLFCEARVSWWSSSDETDYVTRTFYPFLLFVAFHMVIALRSAVVNLPTEQPWRALHQACHLLLAMASVVLLAQFVDCVWQARKDG